MALMAAGRSSLLFLEDISLCHMGLSIGQLTTHAWFFQSEKAKRVKVWRRN